MAVIDERVGQDTSGSEHGNLGLETAWMFELRYVFLIYGHHCFKHLPLLSMGTAPMIITSTSCQSSASFTASIHRHPALHQCLAFPSICISACRSPLCSTLVWFSPHGTQASFNTSLCLGFSSKFTILSTLWKMNVWTFLCPHPALSWPTSLGFCMWGNLQTYASG